MLLANTFWIMNKILRSFFFFHLQVLLLAANILICSLPVMINKLNAGILNKIRSELQILCYINFLSHLQVILLLKFLICFTGYPVLSWPSKWCLLLGSSSHHWHIAYRGSWFCLPGINFIVVLWHFYCECNSLLAEWSM